MKDAAVTVRSPLYRLAYVLSALGNPLFTSALILGAVCLRLLDRTRAIEVLAASLAGLILPIALWNGTKVRNGRYSDFDVSRREDRTTMYPIIIGLTLLSSGALFMAHQPPALSGGMLAASVMTSAAALVNCWKKISLHAAFSFFFAVGSAALSPSWVAPLAIFATLVACSRLVLKRHTMSELILGTGLGLLTGSLLLWAL